ncbi:Tight junction protein ZO-1 [Eufriesea mexicana]|uniref:Tight junction protein ZO-1 n=1 Tax=Eufriesea mexicana TaxID=516756 RepID=A0A310SD53_9HYME|nr:Tight junction protein ZO-1 [Eufriesea mexicana]
MDRNDNNVGVGNSGNPPNSSSTTHGILHNTSGGTDAQNGDRGWEVHHVTVTRVPGYGFGIAVSGGRDNPHFTNGDPAIAISDVLKAGPAEGKLQVNDRIISANGISLEGADYGAAIRVLRDSGSTVLLVVKRRASSNTSGNFGIVLGCRLYVKEVTRENTGVKPGDVLTRIGSVATDNMSLKEAKKLMDQCKDRLSIVVTRDNSCCHVQQQAKSETGEYLSGTTSYSSQNLYVPPPTRQPIEDKSNLVPRGRARGPLMDVSLSQLDLPATPTVDPPRPPPPRPEDYYSTRRQLYDEDLSRNKVPMPDPRFITFQKEGSVGVRLSGGNETGVFVTAVQTGSPASLQGLQPGDKILKEYDQVVASGKGDSFHIKTHFHYEQPQKGEMSFRSGDVFHVVDTLHNGVVGSWQVFRIGRNNQEVQKGIIPNKARAEELATAQFNATKKEMSASESRDSVSKFPAYERVILRHPGFVRPVVLFGPVADLAREKLLKDFPDKFTSPQMENQLDDNVGKNTKSSGIIRLSAIREVMDRGKHALLDITPNAVDRLNYAQSAHKSSKKLLEQCQKLDKIWGHIFSAVITLTTPEAWYRKLRELIDRQQQGLLWMSQTKPKRNRLSRRCEPEFLSKSAHKSSKKLLEQCQKLDKIWGHIFSAVITLTTPEAWYRKLRELIDRQQQGLLWMSQTKPSCGRQMTWEPCHSSGDPRDLPPPPVPPMLKETIYHDVNENDTYHTDKLFSLPSYPSLTSDPEEALSDDFLFPMTSRLSYASSPESDLELSPAPALPGALGAPSRLKSSSDPSIATQDDIAAPPPYSTTYQQSFDQPKRRSQGGMGDGKYGFSLSGQVSNQSGSPEYLGGSFEPRSSHHSPPDLPPRVDRNAKPSSQQQRNTIGRSAQERLLNKTDSVLDVANYINATPHKANATSSLERAQPKAGSYDSMSSYDSYNNTNGNANYGAPGLSTSTGRLGPNVPDDLKSSGAPTRPHDPYRFTRSTAQPIPNHDSQPRTDYAKYSRTTDYKSITLPQNKPGGSYKPIPPPKPKNYRPPQANLSQPENNGNETNNTHQHSKSYSIATSHVKNTNNVQRNSGQYYYNIPPPNRHDSNLGNSHHNLNHLSTSAHNHSLSHTHAHCSPPMSTHSHSNSASQLSLGLSHNRNSVNHNGYVVNNGHNAPGQSFPTSPGHNREPSGLDLAGSREQRGSAFELYRKPVHHYNAR